MPLVLVDDHPGATVALFDDRNSDFVIRTPKTTHWACHGAPVLWQQEEPLFLGAIQGGVVGVSPLTCFI